MQDEPQGADQDNIEQFLSTHGWGEAQFTPMGADMGLRRYARLERGSEKALFMDMSRAGILETGLQNYVKIAQHCSQHGIRTPEIIAADLESGLSVIEDFGMLSFGGARGQGVSDRALYQKATEVLVALRQSDNSNALELNDYKETLIYARLNQFVEYYMPVARGIGSTQDNYDAFHAALNEIEKNLPPCPMGFCHADYHLENLMWCPDHEKGYGLIDFQDAFWGFCGYDLLNLLEDARQTVPEEIKSNMRALYCAGMNDDDKDAFDAWYSYMSMHFHCRVIGLFIKFATENGGTEFLAHIPRLQGYIKENLKNPQLKPLHEFMNTHHVSLDIDARAL